LLSVLLQCVQMRLFTIVWARWCSKSSTSLDGIRVPDSFTPCKSATQMTIYWNKGSKVSSFVLHCSSPQLPRLHSLHLQRKTNIIWTVSQSLLALNLNIIKLNDLFPFRGTTSVSFLHRLSPSPSFRSLVFQVNLTFCSLLIKIQMHTMAPAERKLLIFRSKSRHL